MSIVVVLINVTGRVVYKTETDNLFQKNVLDSGDDDNRTFWSRKNLKLNIHEGLFV